jgi:hypothetical protein
METAEVYMDFLTGRDVREKVYCLLCSSGMNHKTLDVA